MINRRIIASGLSIVSALAVMGGATFAFFTSTNSSTGNVFAAGDMVLQLDDNNETVTSSPIAASIGGAAMVPGGPAQGGFISLHNNGSINMAEILLGVNQTVNNNNGDGNIADVFNVTVKTGDDNTCTTNPVDRTGAIATALGDGLSPLTMTELVNADYDSLPGINATGTYFLCVDSAMQSTAGDMYQGDSGTFEFVFTAHQDASQ